MKKEALKRIFQFLEEKENKKHKDRDKFIWKLKFNETLTKEDLNVKGGLDLSYSNITSLPKGLKVGHDLDLSNSFIKLLPEGLEVGRNLYLSYELKEYKTWEIKNMIKPGGYINGKIKRQ